MPDTRSRFIEPDIAAYASAHTTSADDLQRELQARTEKETGGAAGMQIGNDQAVLMELVARAMSARRAVEIGTFTGYSALAVARGMGPEGRLLCCDVSEEWTQIARDAWAKAGVADRIELRIGPAIDTLRALDSSEQFDLAFVDADKVGYPDYYEELVPRMRVGGLILADNTLQGGAVVDDAARGHRGTEEVAAIRAFNDRVAADPRVAVVLLPIGDGVSFIQKR
jgi:caffeoyl-CoA O-methyltransferase